MQFVSPPPSAGAGRLHRCLFEILHTARVASCVPPGCRPHNDDNKKRFFSLQRHFPIKENPSVLLLSASLEDGDSSSYINCYLVEKHCGSFIFFLGLE